MIYMIHDREIAGESKEERFAVGAEFDECGLGERLRPQQVEFAFQQSLLTRFQRTEEGIRLLIKRPSVVPDHWAAAVTRLDEVRWRRR